MKKLILLVVFMINFVMVQGTLNVNYEKLLNRSFIEQDMVLWFALLAFGIFGLFTLEQLKQKRRRKKEDHIIDYYA